MLPTLQATIAEGMSAITAAATGALQISSPSKLFKNLVGKNIALGIGAGITDEMPSVIADTKRQMAMLTNVVSQSSRLSPAANAIGNMNSAQSAGLQALSSLQSATPNVNVTVGVDGAARDIFSALNMKLKYYQNLDGVKA